MQCPMVHNNGSSPDRMIDDLCNAAEAVRKAIQAVEACAPHSRDYYVQKNGTAAMIQASAEHTKRIQQLVSVRAELETLIAGIQHQVDERADQRAAIRAQQITLTD